MPDLKYPRVLLKLSGEALAGDKGFGFDFDTMDRLADEVVSVLGTGASVGLVIGGGNIVRGSQLSKTGMDRVAADYMGMLGTVINAHRLQDVLERSGVDTRVMTAIRMEELAEPYIRRRAVRHLEKGRIVIFRRRHRQPVLLAPTPRRYCAPFRSRRTSSSRRRAWRASIRPTRSATRQAKFYDEISYRDVMLEELKVIDQTAITLCKENSLPLIVLNIHRPGAIVAAIRGERVGTLVR